jgi:D-serine deaminase-like pyridoxal phosphate-dependent protein
MRILATSISKPSANTCIFDAGFKWISFEFGLPQLVGGEQVKINMKGDEHISVEYPPEFPSLNIGDKAFFYTTHVCTTNNLYTFAYGVRKDIVECIFEIDAK